MDRVALYIRSLSSCYAQSVKMHGAVIILYFLGLLAVKADGDRAYNTQLKIIGGHPVDIKYRPFMLSLHDSHGFLCGASILSKTWGITALHCLVSVWSSNYYVRAGSNKTNKGGSVHRLTRIHAYNDTYISWFSRMLYHDIALFEVSPPFRFSRTVRPVRLPRPNSGIQRELVVCGWGYTDIEKQKIAETLMAVSVQHVPFDDCVKAALEYATLVKDDYHLCYGGQGKDSCYGDSGGALADKRTIYGIVSFGHQCGQVPGVYVKVSYYRKWIKDVINL